MPRKQKVSSKKSVHQSALTPIHLACISVLIILLAGLNLIVYFSPPKTIVVHAKDNTPLLQTYYLKNLLEQHPTYREGWVVLAKLEAQLGKMKEAEFAIEKIRQLDPNYEGLESLQRLTTK